MAITNKSSVVIKDISKWLVDTSNDILEELNKEVLANTPIDTGYLYSRQHIEKRISKVGQTGSLLNDAPYSGYVEFRNGSLMYQKAILKVKQKY